MFKEW
ncbi:hypothetical protein CP061683_1101A, partial [Chlamydia psittaci 06-1683]